MNVDVKLTISREDLFKLPVISLIVTDLRSRVSYERLTGTIISIITPVGAFYKIQICFYKSVY